MNKDTKIVWKPIDDLIPYEHNAKEHDQKQIDNLAVSFKKYGWQNVVLIDENNVIVYGHGRCLGAKKAGLTEAPTILCTDLTEQERREYRILDNKLTESAWIDEELEFELPELDFSDFDLDFDLMVIPNNEEVEGGAIDDNSMKECIVRIKFDNVKQFREIETQLREILSDYKKKVSV